MTRSAVHPLICWRGEVAAEGGTVTGTRGAVRLGMQPVGGSGASRFQGRPVQGVVEKRMETVNLFTLIRRYITQFGLGIAFLGSGQDLDDFSQPRPRWLVIGFNASIVHGLSLLL